MSSSAYLLQKLQSQSTSLGWNNDKYNLLTAQYPTSMVQKMVKYLYTGVMKKPEEKDEKLYQQLMDEFGLKPHYTNPVDQKLLGKLQSNYLHKLKDLHRNDTAHEFGKADETGIKQEIGTAFAITNQSKNDMDHRSKIGNVLDKNVYGNENGDIKDEPADDNEYVSDMDDRHNKNNVIESDESDDDQEHVKESQDDRSEKRQTESPTDIKEELLKLIKMEVGDEQTKDKHSKSEADVDNETREAVEIDSGEESDNGGMEFGEKSSEKPLCNICGKICKRKYDLKRHMRSHSKEPVGSCPICNKSFITAQYLRQHMRTHSDRKYSNLDLCQNMNKPP